MNKFDEANIAVYALSYDEADALRDFRNAQNISYTLLSDPESEVIKSFGILNTLIDENDHPWYGIPYPGTYVVDADGKIMQKFFENNLAIRAGPEQLLHAALGEPLAATNDGVPKPVEEVEVSVHFDGASLTPTVQKDLVAQFRVPAGYHVYASPAPAGLSAVDLILDDNEDLVQRPIMRPPAESHSLAGTDETFDVYHNVFELRLPLTVNNAGKPEITITGELIWQSCDDQVCGIPARKRFAVTLPVTASPLVAIGSKKGAALEPNAMAHFVKMTERRKKDKS